MATVFDKETGVCCPRHDCSSDTGQCIRHSCCCSQPLPKSAFRYRTSWCPIILDLVSDQFYSFVLLVLLLFRYTIDSIFSYSQSKFLFGQNAYSDWMGNSDFIGVCQDPNNGLRFILQACRGIDLGSPNISYINPINLPMYANFVMFAANTTWNHRIWLWLGWVISVFSVAAVSITCGSALAHTPRGQQNVLAQSYIFLLIDSTIMFMFSWLVAEETEIVPLTLRQSCWSRVGEYALQAFRFLDNLSFAWFKNACSTSCSSADSVSVQGSLTEPMVSASSGTESIELSEPHLNVTADREHVYVSLYTALRKQDYWSDAVETGRLFSSRLLSASIFCIFATMLLFGQLYLMISYKASYISESIDPICKFLIDHGLAPDLDVPLAVRVQQIDQFIAVLKAACQCAWLFALVGSIVSQFQLQTAFRRDTMLEVYWRLRERFPALVELETPLNPQFEVHSSGSVRQLKLAPLPDVFAGRSQSLTGAPLLFGYAICNAVFLGMVLWLIWMVSHLSIGCDVIRTALVDMLIPHWTVAEWFESVLEILTVVMRITLFWFVQTSDGFRPRITQYRLYCFFDLFYLVFAYHIGFYFIGARLVVSLMGKVVNLFRLDVSQVPSSLNGLDPLHNAYLSAVLIEAQIQCELVDTKADAAN